MSSKEYFNRNKNVLIDEIDGKDIQSEFSILLSTTSFFVTFDFNVPYFVNGIRIYTWHYTTIDEVRVRLFFSRFMDISTINNKLHCKG